jgi:hypothetical protein
MSLDATVYCDCFERGRLRTPPLPQWNLYVDEYGGRSRSSLTGGLGDDLAFDRWNVTACEHEDGVLLHHYLGNIARVGLVREALSGHAESFPIILRKVVYNGVHGGDFLAVEQVESLRPELDALKRVRPDDQRQARCVRDFEAQLTELVGASLRLRKPISF